MVRITKIGTFLAILVFDLNFWNSILSNFFILYFTSVFIQYLAIDKVFFNFLTHFTFVSPLCLEHSKKLSNIKQVISNNDYGRHLVDLILKMYSNRHITVFLTNPNKPTNPTPTHQLTPNLPTQHLFIQNIPTTRLHQNSSYKNSFVQLFPTLGMQLFLSKTASCSYSPPSVCSPYEGKKGKKITINTTFTSPPPPPHYPPPTSPPTYLTTTTCSPSRHLHPHLLPSTHSHTPCTNTFPLLPLLRTQIFIHP